MSAPVPTRRRVRVRGRVQGVAFRAFTAEKARAAGVGGWVRNLPDGSVEAVFEGRDGAVEELVRCCHRGPAWAQVERVEVFEETPEGLEDFRVR